MRVNEDKNDVILAQTCHYIFTPVDEDSKKVLCGAEEACWAHNPKVLGSKPSRAIFLRHTPFYLSYTPNIYLPSHSVNNLHQIMNEHL